MRYTFNRESKQYIKAIDTEVKIAFSTDIEPVIPEKHIAIWNGAGWDYEEVFEYTYKLDADGFVSDEGTTVFKTDTEQPSVDHKNVGGSWVLDEDSKLGHDKDDKKASIDVKYNGIINEGYEVDSKKYHYDDTTLSIIAARLAHCNSTTNLGAAELVFFDSSKEPISFTDKASIVQFFEDFITSRNHIDQRKLILKHEVDLAKDSAELQAIDIESGW